MGKVVYLTGVPASGKSSLCSMLEERVPNTRVFRFGYELTELVKLRTNVTQEELRSRTTHIVTPDDVALIDQKAVDYAREHRSTSNIIIDTHALTREPFGFRMTPLSHQRIVELAPDFFVTMTATPRAILSRVTRAAKGRPILSVAQLEMQAALQGTISSTYAILCGKPAFFFENENEGDLESIAQNMIGLLGGEAARG